MTMGWMETIRFIGLDLQVAAVLAVGSLHVAARVLRSVGSSLPSGTSLLASVRVRARRLYPSSRMHPVGHGTAS
jgi:hypothetical protein